ncbi:hypothetical protein J15TS10_36320 [Paenibacillus woosongensis]|uniref:Uncharacterized protein n=1 Tax=Paenibacillus woosongensis TaxID=307580 RepID=A0ABQ4MV67_9BACL|nr:hypothetical protein J15TS10_36320 [Paenibacillus woosongensis]
MSIDEVVHWRSGGQDAKGTATLAYPDIIKELLNLIKQSMKMLGNNEPEGVSVRLGSHLLPLRQIITSGG